MSRYEYGVVSQVSPLLVQVDGSTVAVSADALSTYSPTLSARVLILVRGTRLIVLGGLP